MTFNLNVKQKTPLVYSSLLTVRPPCWWATRRAVWS